MNTKSRHVKESALAITAMAGCFVYLLSRTWMKWGDLLVDSFREFWVPMKILEGHILYQDIFYEYGFFPPYLQALLFKVFGLHLHTLAGLGIVITLLVAVALYLISRLFLDIRASALTVIVFFLVFAFNHYFYNNNFNFIFPYSFAATLFLLFTLYAAYAFLKFIASGRYRCLLCWALCLIMAFFCRLEFTLLVWSGFFISGLFYAFKKQQGGNLRFWMLLFMPILSAVAGYLMFIFIFHVRQGFLESVIGPLWYLKNNQFQAQVMGMHNLTVSLKTIGQSTLFSLISFLLPALSLTGLARFKQAPASWSYRLMLIGCLFGLVLPFFWVPAFLGKTQYACLVLLLPASVVYFCYRCSRETDTTRSLQMICLSLLGLLVACRILLRIGPEWYGFYLAIPSLICYHLILFSFVVPYLENRLPGLPRQTLTATYICFLLVLGIGWWMRSEQAYRHRTAEMITARGTFHWFDNQPTRRITQTIAYLRTMTPPDASVVVFPEGIGINVLTDRKNPLKYCNFMPPVLQYIGEDRLIQALARKDVHYVVVVGRTAYDYGAPFFGIHYAQKLSDWVKNNYRLEKVIGDMPFTSRHFGVAIYRKIKS